jgi:hypothetical protein
MWCGASCQGVAGSGSPLEFEATNKRVTANCKLVKDLGLTIERLVAGSLTLTTKPAIQAAQVCTYSWCVCLLCVCLCVCVCVR